MLLEQKIQAVSNRYSQIISAPEKSPFYQAEIKEKISSAADKNPPPQEKSTPPKNPLKELKPILKLDALPKEYFPSEPAGSSLDYGQLFSYLENPPFPSEELYSAPENPEEDSSLLMSDEQAEETVQKIQLSYLTDNKDSLPYQEKEKFHYWQEFNKALLMLYHCLSPVHNDNVDYSKLN